MPSQRKTVSFCHRGNYIQAALGMTCSETYEAIAFAYWKKKIRKRKSCSLLMAVASGSSSCQALLTSRGFHVFIGKWQLLLQDSFTLHVVPTCLPFSTRQQRKERGFRTRVKAGQSLMREKSDSLLVWTLSLHTSTITRAEGGRAGK